MRSALSNIGVAIVRVLSLCVCPMASALEVSITVQLGEDRGSALGTFFEVFDATGKLLAGAGGIDAYGTFVRENPRTVTLYHRTREPVAEPIGRPQGDRCIRYNLMSWRGKLVDTYCRWEFGSAAWMPASWLPRAIEGRADGYLQPLGSGVLAFLGREIRFNEATIWTAPLDGYRGLYPAYYNLGRFFIARVGMLYVCPWKPGQSAFDLNGCDSFPLTGNAGDEIAFAYGTHGDDVLIGGNRGGLWRWRGSRLSLITRTTDGQWYSMGSYQHGIVLGHYPSGRVYHYDGDRVTRWEGPPVMPGASPSEREAQSMALYGGDLYVGVWPWGELYRRDFGTGEWEFVSRLFPTPTPSQETTPYYSRLRSRGLRPYDEWGQRIKTLTLHKDSLYAGTSNRGGHGLTQHWSVLTRSEREPYGIVHRITVPRVISAELKWSPRTTLRFVIDEERLAIFQDGKLLGERLSPELNPSVGQIVFGRGLHGPLRGIIISRQSN